MAKTAAAPHPTLGGIYQGVLAEFVTLSEGWLVRAPSSIDDDEASTLPCAGLTAWSALVELGLILFLVTFVVNGIARVLVWNVTRKTGGVARAA